MKTTIDAGGPLIAMVALRAPAALDGDALAARWRATWKDAPAFEDVSARDATTLGFALGDELAAIGGMPSPIPWTDVGGPCETAWHWPDATAVMKAHTNHAIVTLIGGRGDAIDRHLTLTRLVATVAEELRAVGVYWGGGCTVQPAKRFIDTAAGASREKLPLTLWIEFRLFEESPGRLCLFTTGMDELGHMEIEVRGSRLGARDLFERVFDVAHYLADAGPVLKDGDTFGASEDERVAVRHDRSAWPRDGKVIVLGL